MPIWKGFYVGKHPHGEVNMLKNIYVERVLCRKTSIWKEFNVGKHRYGKSFMSENLSMEKFHVGKDRYGKSFMSENLDIDQVLCRKTSTRRYICVGEAIGLLRCVPYR
jgi:hypothetical protein